MDERAAAGLWLLADRHEQRGGISEAIKCVEAICQSQPAFLPLTEVKSRVRVAALLLEHTENVGQARHHLERAQLLLKQIPSCFELKCRTLSLLTKCYRLGAALGPQKKSLKQGLELALAEGPAGLQWACNFSLQMASTSVSQGEFTHALHALETGLKCAAEANQPEIGMVFATSMVHVRLLNAEEAESVDKALEACESVWCQIPSGERSVHQWMWLYKELLHAFHLLRICEYKDATSRVSGLEVAVARAIEEEQQGGDGPQWQLMQELSVVREELSKPYYCHARKMELLERQRSLQVQLEEHGGVEVLGLRHAMLETKAYWLPSGIMRALVNLVSISCLRPKGLFKECMKLLQAGLVLVEQELTKLGICNEDVKEADLPNCSMYVAATSLMIWMQLVENKVVMDLTMADYTSAQEALMKMVNYANRFTGMLQPYDCSLEMLLGQYAHAVGCVQTAARHFIKASDLADNAGLQARCHIYAALSLLCIGDQQHCSQALDLLHPVLEAMDTYVGVREKTLVLFVSGILQVNQHNGQDARTRLASGLRLTYRHLGNNQLVSQYLTVLGSIAVSMHDLDGAEKILSSSVTLAKALFDIPSQIAIMDELNGLFRELGDKVRQKSNAEAQEKKREELSRRIEAAKVSEHHQFLLDFRLADSRDSSRRRSRGA